MSPTLRHCSLSIIHPELKSLATRCAALEHLSLKIPEWERQSADDRTLLCDSVRLCKRLVTLSCLPLDWASWKHLSDLPSLLKVSVCEPRSASRWPTDWDITNFTPFRNITTLSFNVNTAAYAITAMQHSEFPSLKEFEMVADVLPCSEAEKLFRALSKCSAKQTLQHINIASRIAKDQEPSGESLAAVTQLFCFSQLRTLRLNLHYCIHIDNDLLLEAIASWPHILSLELIDSRMPTTITFRGLFAALRLCPHLHTLRIFMDLVDIDIDPTTESFQHTTLHTLEFSRSDVADAKAVARIIFSVLPCVDHVNQRDTWDVGMIFYNVWDKVNSHLRYLKSSAVVVDDIKGAVAKS